MLLMSTNCPVAEVCFALSSEHVGAAYCPNNLNRENQFKQANVAPNTALQ